ncbi:potentiating neddylation domain-containing protein [Scleroderma citrinum]
MDENGMDRWTKKLGVRSTLPQLRERLRSDVVYFRAVYNHTFNFTRSEGQRSLAIDTALAYWELLLPFGLSGGALKHHPSSSNDTSTTPLLNRDVRYRNNHYQDADIDMDGESEDEDEKDEDREEGWGNEHTEWWLEYMRERGGRGVSKDTWQMLADFIQSIDAKFEKHDVTAAWPSTIDDFVEWARDKKIKTKCHVSA